MHKQPPLVIHKIAVMEENLPKSYCSHWYDSAFRNECRCGETDSQQLQWTWSESVPNPTLKLVDNRQSVVFHPVYSQGTAIVRGESPLSIGRHHFWEVKTTSAVCGTDLMVGVGTDRVDTLAYKYSFVSALGLDDQSWGFSYRGIAQHDGLSRYYGQKFGAGSILGIHLDLFRGTIEFYLNRTPLGVAFKGLPVDGSKSYYPMVCATSAKSSVKLLNSSSFPECLQYQAMRSISRNPATLNELQKYPGRLQYNEDLWYLQRTEKFVYRRPTILSEKIFEQPIGLEDPDDNRMAVDADDSDIYGGIDEVVAEIRECHKRSRSNHFRCNNNNDHAPSGDEDESDDLGNMVLFSFFCDHFS